MIYFLLLLGFSYDPPSLVEIVSIYAFSLIEVAVSIFIAQRV